MADAESVKLTIMFQVLEGRYILMSANGQWSLYDIKEIIEANHADD